MVSLSEVLCLEGTISILLGLPGSGKTNIATFLMQQAVKHGFSVYTNIHFFKDKDVEKAIKMKRLPELPNGKKYGSKPKEIKTVTTISDLLLGLLGTKKNTTFIDEGGFFATSTMATSKKVRQIKELSYIIRHLNSSLILIAQSKGSIVPDLRKTLVTYELSIEKKTHAYRVLSVRKSMPFRTSFGERDIKTVEVDRIGRVPMAEIPWDGYFLPKFKFDIDLSKAFDELGEYNSVEVLKEGPNIIKKMRERKKKEEKSITSEKKEVREDVREMYMTLEDSGCFKNRTQLLGHIGAAYGKTSQWAYQLCGGLPFDKDKYNPEVNLDYDEEDAN